MHIGFNNYEDLKEPEEFKQVTESHIEVETYYKFFKEELKYHKAVKITD